MISSVNPPGATAGAPLNFTINGSQFVSGATVKLNGVSLSVTFVNNARLDVTGAAFTTAGTYMLVVTNPGPGGGSASTTFTIAPGAVASIVIAPTSATVVVGGSQSFSASAFDAWGNPIPSAVFTWSVSLATRGSVSPTSGASTTFTAGTGAGTFPGLVDVSSGAVNATANVTITPGPLHSLTLSPASATLPANGTQAFVATGRDIYGNVITTGSVQWQMANTNAGQINPTGPYAATFQATTMAGNYPNAILAFTGTVEVFASITVTPGPLHRIQVNPDKVFLAAGDLQSFTAVGYDAYTNVIPSLAFTWSADPQAGSIESSGPTSAVFRAGATPDTYFAGVTAASDSVIGHADIAVREGNVAAVVVEPSPVSIGVNGTQIFTARVVDAFGNAIPDLGVTWQAPQAAGSIVSFGTLTAEFRAGNVAGVYDTAIVASNGPIANRVRVTVLPGAPSAIQMSAHPTTIQLNGVQSSTIVITITDNFGNPIGTSAPVELAVDQCVGRCILDPPSGNTDNRGVFVTRLRGEYSSPSQSADATMIVTVRTPGANGVLQRSVAVSGVFRPQVRFAPLIGNGPPNNHTACTALRLTPPQSVSQPANNAFNIYRLTAAKSSYRISISGFATSGQLLLYRVTDDRCATTGLLSLSFVQSVALSDPTTQATLSNFIAGVDYLLAVHVTGAATNQPYTLVVQP